MRLLTRTTISSIKHKTPCRSSRTRPSRTRPKGGQCTSRHKYRLRRHIPTRIPLLSHRPCGRMSSLALLEALPWATTRTGAVKASFREIRAGTTYQSRSRDHERAGSQQQPRFLELEPTITMSRMVATGLTEGCEMTGDSAESFAPLDIVGSHKALSISAIPTRTDRQQGSRVLAMPAGNPLLDFPALTPYPYPPDVRPA